MYQKIRHSCFDLRYHLVLVAENKQPIVRDNIEDDLKEYVVEYFNNNKIDIIEYNSNVDHIHIVFNGKPNLNLSNFVNGLKTNSSKFIRKKYKDAIFSYDMNSFWSRSYFVGIFSDNVKDIANSYIENEFE